MPRGDPKKTGRTRKNADKGEQAPKSKLARLELQIQELHAMMLARDTDETVKDTLSPPPRPIVPHAGKAGGELTGGGDDSSSGAVHA